MAIWPFNRKTDDSLPEEVREYYESERKQKAGMAWLLALGTLIVTIVLAAILFYTGRWIVQQFTDKETVPVNPVTTQTVAPENQSQPSDSTTENQQGTSSSNTDQEGSQTTTPAPAPAPTPAPSTGSTSPEVPDTGPGPGGLQ